MRFSAFLCSFCLMFPVVASAQGVPAPATAAAAGAENDQAGKNAEDDWRNTDGYRFPAIAKTVADMQNLAYAMTLRDYCSDRKVPDAFVRERLARFSQISGREETCRTLLDY